MFLFSFNDEKKNPPKKVGKTPSIISGPTGLCMATSEKKRTNFSARCKRLLSPREHRIFHQNAFRSLLFHDNAYQFFISECKKKSMATSLALLNRNESSLVVDEIFFHNKYFYEDFITTHYRRRAKWMDLCETQAAIR